MTAAGGAWPGSLVRLLQSAELARAFTLAALGTGFAALLIGRTAGPVTLAQTVRMPAES